MPANTSIHAPHPATDAGAPRSQALTVTDPRTGAPVARVVVVAADPRAVAVTSAADGRVTVFADGLVVTVTLHAGGPTVPGSLAAAGAP